MLWIDDGVVRGEVDDECPDCRESRETEMALPEWVEQVKRECEMCGGRGQMIPDSTTPDMTYCSQCLGAGYVLPLTDEVRDRLARMVDIDAPTSGN